MRRCWWSCDDDRFAVLDLPAGRWSADNGSAYMYYQLTHGRPIAWGYLSRQFVKYPIDGMMGILDQANAPDALATRQRLAQLGYRYVVWHKRAKELFGTRRPDTSDRFRIAASGSAVLSVPAQGVRGRSAAGRR